MIALGLFVLAGCLALAPTADSIGAGTLAPGYPEMAALPADTSIAPAPLPGVPRVFHPAELRRLAAIYHLSSAPQSDICVVRPVGPLDPEGLLETMRREWPEAHIELLEFSRQPAPEGVIHFSRGALHPGSGTSSNVALWSGWVQYGANRRFSIWARVHLTAQVQRVLALNDLSPGKPIEARDVLFAAREEPVGLVLTAVSAPTLDQVIGKCPRQLIHAGDSVRPAWLEEPKLVLRGDTVKVWVSNGGAQLELDAQAEGSGAVGQTVLVRNPDSGRRFRARITAKDTLVVDAGGAKP